MGKLIAWNIMSLDGFFEGDEPWDLRLHEHIWGEDLRDLSLQFGEEAGLIVFGRTTYEGMVAHWPNDTSEPEIARYMNSIPKLVASRTVTDAEWNNTEVTADPVAELARRKQGAEQPIYVFGSAKLVDSLLDASLVDELLIGIAPVILGSGTPLLKERVAARPLRLLESRVVDTGGVLLRYRVTDA
ncbi:dihydrofolate reductase family protein [Nesterenkonia sp. K-15-9-6]|uniref:dihydrofolate reductase family protein n=1 Tax=Nesterenkonia sp. K-15-9-6 TaxID=3093918 RepID=UPI004044ED2D